MLVSLIIIIIIIISSSSSSSSVYRASIIQCRAQASEGYYPGEMKLSRGNSSSCIESLRERCKLPVAWVYKAQGAKAFCATLEHNVGFPVILECFLRNFVLLL